MSNELKLEGRVVQLLEAQQGTSSNGEWKKQEFILETNDEYPRSISIIGFKEMADKVSKLNVGDNVEVSVNIESREYNSRWYTDVKAWKISSTSKAKAAVEEEEVPF
jgi:hypothetical protein